MNEIEDEIARLRRENDQLKMSLMQTKQKQQIAKMVPNVMMQTYGGGVRNSSDQISSGGAGAGNRTTNPYQHNLLSSGNKQSTSGHGAPSSSYAGGLGLSDPRARLPL
jgi:hypothetical protein